MCRKLVVTNEIFLGARAICYEAYSLPKRQTEGIMFGRQPIQLNESEFMTVYNSWKAAEINARQAMNILGIKPNTFYRRVKEYEATQNIQPKATKTNEAAI